ncbi:hypothetical protein HN018_22755 (plasmid) [Lichenicola cladoniae]|uniref:Uncharacterized protein n=1 Tax=Lichenicola cladoniae TaxID=1484109 RepID=A0A6M8HWS0_9PROT|nr:hypothetical protein [Lichenicola cladoniae]NPD69323.1 hypothetical protein [Acetobacteraceae bacterium]QKE93024.1 hypothetical protein HN018_22755 [Lichenicola cladoniae]
MAASRRELLKGGAISALVGVATVVLTAPASADRGADAELIAIGREAVALIEKRKPLEARWWAIPTGGDYNDPAIKTELDTVSDAMVPIDDRLSEMADRAVELRAHSREAMIAKAWLVHHEMKVVHVSDGVVDTDRFEPHELLAWSLLEDLLGAAAFRARCESVPS